MASDTLDDSKRKIKLQSLKFYLRSKMSQNLFLHLCILVAIFNVSLAFIQVSCFYLKTSPTLFISSPYLRYLKERGNKSL